MDRPTSHYNDVIFTDPEALGDQSRKLVGFNDPRVETYHGTRIGRTNAGEDSLWPET